METVIFTAILIPAGLLIYATYWRNFSVMNAIRSAKNPVAKLLNRGYFFDDFYEKGVARAAMAFSGAIKFFEVVVLEIFPVVFANLVVRFAGGVHKYFDVAADQMLNVMGARTMEGASKVRTIDTLADRLLDVIGHKTDEETATRKTTDKWYDRLASLFSPRKSGAPKRQRAPPNSLQHYLAAALIGFIMLVILIIISVRGF